MASNNESISDHLETARILEGWLRDIEFDLRQPLKPYPTELYDQLREWILCQGLEEYQLVLLLRLLPACTSAADSCYPRASFDLKRYIALHTTFFLYVDDRAEKDLEKVLPDLRCIASKSIRGLHSIPCKDAAIALWLNLVVSETDHFFGPYSTGVITKGFLDFILVNIVEADLAKSLTLPAKFASRSSQFIRDKTGAGEVFAHFLFPDHLITESQHLQTYIQFVPLMVDIINHVNDILSFFKESVVGSDENTHIMNMARAVGCAPQEILKKVCLEMAEAIKVIQISLRDIPNVREIWNEFVNGFIMWHIYHDRYRLKELGLIIQPET
jgi:hypothetical protein